VRIEIRDGSESRPDVAPLAAAVYPPEVLATVVWRDVVSARASRRVLVYNDTTLVAAVGMHTRKGTVDGREADIAGIGGVMTLPTARRRGFGTAAMTAAHEIIAREGVSSFGLLFCEADNFHFYEGLGWSQFGGMVIAEQPGHTGLYTIMPTLVRQFRDVAPIAGVVDLCGLPW
jgi:GNAT superfamily N-acetyltransferase